MRDGESPASFVPSRYRQVPPERAFSFTEVVKPIADPEQSRPWTRASQQMLPPPLTTRFECTNEMVYHFPCCQSLVLVGSQFAGSSSGLSSRTLPPLSQDACIDHAGTLVFLALESVSATPYSPSVNRTVRTTPAPSDCRRQNHLPVQPEFHQGLVNKCQCLAHRDWLAFGIKNLCITSVNTAIPGPIAAWARSTGAMLPRCRCLRAIGKFSFESCEKLSASSGGCSRSASLRQTRTMLEARALVPIVRACDYRSLFASAMCR